MGDVADKGCQNLACLDFWIEQVNNGGAFWVHGNHCNKLYRYFLGNRVHLSHGLERTVAELEALPKEERMVFRSRYMRCYESQCFYLLLDRKRLAAVSYTHLDVYKRQVLSFSFRLYVVMCSRTL